MTWRQVSYEQLRVDEPHSGVALLTLDLPERRNMMSQTMTGSWLRLRADLAADQALRAVVITGTPPAFCSGGDTSWIVSDPSLSIEALRARMSAFYRDWVSMAELAVPVIAAVNGAAVGAGLALALACDIRYVAEDAPLSLPFTQLGMHPGVLTTWTLSRVGSLAVARDLLLTGRTITGAEGLRLGLASASTPAEEVLPTALRAAAAIAAAAPVATRLTKQALAGDGPLSRDQALAWEALAQSVTLASGDVQEGMAARREKRSPRFADPG